MIYPLDLKQAGLAAGALLVIGHLWALARPSLTRQWLASFPRSQTMGVVLMVAAGVWSFLLVRTLDLGEFAGLRMALLFGIAAGTVLATIYMQEFLAVRALGMLLLLAAEPILEAAFLRPEISRLLLVVLAYAWIFAGLFWVGMPYLLRDQIAWVLAKPWRWRLVAGAGLAYGLAVLICAFLFWG